MLHGEALGLLLGAVALGAVHGIEPGHGWPVAAAYALDRSNTWFYGLAASLLIGVGHLVSSIAMVGLFFLAKDYFDLAAIDEPIRLAGGVAIGGPVSLVAGLLLIGLGVREYRHGHDHGVVSPDPSDPHDHGAHDHHHDGAHDHHHDHAPVDDSGPKGILDRVRRVLPSRRGHGHEASRLDEPADRGLIGIAWFAFVLGFAHEEEFEIIALCAGSIHCLELMVAYALTVVVGIVGLTLALIAGYEHFEGIVGRYTPYLPLVSATVLVGMGLGFVVGLF